jgi:hypothetical protein
MLYTIYSIKRRGAPLTPAFDLFNGYMVLTVFLYNKHTFQSYNRLHRFFSGDFSTSFPKGQDFMKRFCCLALLLVVLLSGCVLPGMPTPTATVVLPPAAVATKVVPLNTLAALPTFTKAADQPKVVTATSAGPAATLPAPTAIKPPATVPAATQPAATQVPATTAPLTSKDVKMFMIAIGDNGVSGSKIGCGDSAVGVVITVPDAQAPLRGALEKLLANHTKDYGQSGLYNALFRSDLQLKSVSITNAVADIRLTGALTLGGECDSPRVQAQLEQVALQFSTVKSVNIFINDKNLKDILSLK